MVVKFSSEQVEAVVQFLNHCLSFGSTKNGFDFDDFSIALKNGVDFLRSDKELVMKEGDDGCGSFFNE